MYFSKELVKGPLTAPAILNKNRYDLTEKEETAVI